jgi:MoaA/NifB/PqqE/SkfB family radical SAM enzyme
MPIPPGAAAPQNSESVQFLWLELTNLCDLQCVHCYVESRSSPISPGFPSRSSSVLSSTT